MAAILEYEYINIMRKTGLPVAISKQILRQVSGFGIGESVEKGETLLGGRKTTKYVAGSGRDWDSDGFFHVV